MNRKGYNLIEVLIAMALLSWVILVISGLFIFGQKGVYSGKMQTKAVAVGQKVYEDIKNLPNYDQKFLVFSAVRDAASKSLTVDVDYSNPFTSGDVLWQVIEGWKGVLADIGPTAQIEATLTPEIAVDTTAAAAFGNSFFIHYRIQVRWVEGMRPRVVTFDFSI
jgi:prepilin-type N-terminal cleavage/methylation domain-containing protein